MFQSISDQHTIHTPNQGKSIKSINQSIYIIYQIPYNATYSYYTPYYSLKTSITYAATFTNILP